MQKPAATADRAEASPRQKLNRRDTFAAFRYPNYRIWFAGQLVSLMGTWMQMTAQGFLVYELTHSSAYLGIVGFASGLPIWLLSLYGGVIADRVSRRRLMMITQSVMMILALILAALTYWQLIQAWQIVLLAFCLGVANAFDAPARQAIVFELVSRQDLTNAIALNATMFNAATAVGPAVAGLTYAAFGPSLCFALNGISFIAVIAALFQMRLARIEPNQRRKAHIELLEGLRYVTREPMVRTLIAIVAVVSMFGLSFATLMPAWAAQILHGGARENGFLQSARGIGALISAFALAALSRRKIKGRLLAAGLWAFPILLISFSLIKSEPFSLLTLVGVGAAMLMVLNVANALIQSLVPDDLRGRVMGIYSWIFFGFMPIGSLWVGGAAHQFGLQAPLIIGSVAVLAVTAAVLIFLPRIRLLA